MEIIFYHSPCWTTWRNFVVTLDQFFRPPWLRKNKCFWIQAEDLGILGLWAGEWDSYILTLNRAGIRLNKATIKLV